MVSMNLNMDTKNVSQIRLDNEKVGIEVLDTLLKKLVAYILTKVLRPLGQLEFTKVN